MGVFFLELFQLIDHWQKIEVWDRECKEYTGFAKVMGKQETITLGEYVKIVESIHKRVATGLIVCLSSSVNPMKTKCGLTILNKLSNFFPNQYIVAKALQKHLQSLVDRKSSIDSMLYTLAFSCNSKMLKKMETMPKPQSVTE